MSIAIQAAHCVNPAGEPAAGAASGNAAGRWIAAFILGVSLNLACSGVALSQQVIKWGVAGANLSYAAPLLGALAPEIFSKYGIRVEITDLRGNANNCMAAMMTGSLDVCHAGITSGMDVIAEGGDIKGFALLTAPIAEISLSAKTFSALKVSAEAPIEDRLRALKGLRIVSAGPGSPNYVALAAMLAKVGLTFQDIRFRTVLDPVAMMEGMRADQIDAAMWSIGPLTPAQLDKNAVRFVNLARGDFPAFKGTPYIAAYAQTAWVNKNMDLLRRAQLGIGDAIALMKADQGKYSALMKAKYAPDLPQAIWDDTYRQAQAAMLDGGKATASGWNYMLSLQVADSKRDYTKASFENSVLPFAQAR